MLFRFFVQYAAAQRGKEIFFDRRFRRNLSRKEQDFDNIRQNEFTHSFFDCEQVNAHQRGRDLTRQRGLRGEDKRQRLNTLRV